MKKFLAVFLLYLFSSMVGLATICGTENPKIMVAALMSQNSLESKIFLEDLLQEYPNFWLRHSDENGEIYFALMNDEAHAAGQELNPLQVLMGKKKEKVRLKVETTKQGLVYHLLHPSFNPGALSPERPAGFSDESKAGWDLCYPVILYAKAVAALAELHGVSIFHGVDIAALAAYYIDKSRVAIASLLDVNEAANIKMTIDDPNVRMQVQITFGIKDADIDEYFLHDGSLQLIRVLGYISRHNLYAGIMPSSWASSDMPHRKRTLATRTSSDMRSREDYRLHFGNIFDPDVWVGVDCGLSPRHHPSQNLFLRKLRPFPQALFEGLDSPIQSQLLTFWQQVKPFGTEGSLALSEFNFQKYLLRSILRLLTNIDDGPRPTFLLVGPIEISAAVELSAFINKRGADLIISEVAEFDRLQAALLQSVSSADKNQGKTVVLRSALQDDFWRLLLFGAADFLLHPSHYQISPIYELLASSHGVFSIARNFTNADASDSPFLYSGQIDQPEDELVLMKAGVIRGLLEIRKRRSNFDEVRLQNMAPRYNLEEVFKWYARIYEVIFLHKTLRSINCDQSGPKGARNSILRQVEDPKVLFEYQNAIRKLIQAKPETANEWEKSFATRTKPQS